MAAVCDDRAVAEVVVRAAAPPDASFLALAMQEADRGHTGIGSWDVFFPGPADERLRTLSALAVAKQRSYVHWSMFLVAEVGGTPVATIAGYVPDTTPSELFAAACRTVLGPDTADAKLSTAGAWSRDYFTVDMPRDTLRVEWVYTDPRFRGRALNSRLTARLLENARQQGIKTAHVGTYIGNEPAIAAYRRAGFHEFAECRHEDYEQRFRAPGCVVLRRAL